MELRAIAERLLESDEPSVRWKVRVGALGEDPRSEPIRRLREEIRTSPRVRRLLENPAPNVYSKWRGAHWVLLRLADLGYPPGADELVPLRDAVLPVWLSVPQRCVDGRHRQHASQPGAALLAVIELGIDDGRSAELAEQLLGWQWPDGGWNCDRHRDASTSSVHETLLAMRGLAAYARTTGDERARKAVDRAAEVFLGRELLYSRSTGKLVKPAWAKLHYPSYWHYDLLGALRGLAEADRIDDRCARGLEVLRSKQIEDGWPAEAKYSGDDPVSWGGVSRVRANEWVTAEALSVLAAHDSHSPKA